MRDYLAWGSLASLYLTAAFAILHVELNFFRKRLHPWMERNAIVLGAYRSVVSLISFPLIIVGGYLTISQLRDELELPDVALVFYRPERPMFRIVNVSSVVVREAEYDFVLYDLDMKEYSTREPALMPILSKTLDPIRPNDAIGPYEVTSLFRSAYGPGNRIFGYARVSCPLCSKIRYYWFYADLGQGGWYSEIPDEQVPTVSRSLAGVVHGGDGYVERIGVLVPPGSRKQL